MIYGYARVSTDQQDLAYQLERLKAAGCDKIFQEKQSGKNTQDRPQFLKMLKGIGRGDVVLATVTDRVARDPLDMLNTLRAIRDAGAGLRLLDEPFIDTTSEMSDVIIYLIGWAAGLHRKSILRNTANGRDLAKRRGVKFGPKFKLTPHQRREALERREKGEESVSDIARSYNVHHSTISRLKP